MLAIVSYMLAVMVVPVLHRLHHLAHGNDHVHTAAGTIYLGEHDASDQEDAGHYHAEFDQIFAELGLSEVAAAGTLTVDCAYTELTLATCDATATANHPRTFGDDLLARTHTHRTLEESDHGAGSLEHSQAHYLCAAPIVLPLPAQPLSQVAVDSAYEAPRLALRITHDSRGPPRAI